MRAVVLFPLLCCLAGSAQQWTQLADFPGTPRDDAASFTLEGRVFVGTGMDAGFQLTNDWYAFDVQAGTWQSAPSLPAPGRQYCAGFAFGGNGFLFGGLSGTGPLNELWRYDPNTEEWSLASPLPSAGRYATTVITMGERACICGGLLDGGIPTNETWCYDRTTDAWSVAAPLPGAPRHRATSVDLVVVGGADVDYQPLADAHRYDPVNDAWVTVAPLPAARFAADGVEQLLIGGASSTAAVHADCWWYDTLTEDWNSLNIPAFEGGPRRGGVTGMNLVLMDAFMAFYGTGSDNVQRYSDWWRFDMPVGVPEVGAGGVTIHPVPARDQLHVELQEGSIASPFQVVDVQGRELMRLRGGSSRYTVDVSGLAPGTYIIRALTGRQWQRRFMVVP